MECVLGNIEQPLCLRFRRRRVWELFPPLALVTAKTLDAALLVAKRSVGPEVMKTVLGIANLDTSQMLLDSG